MWRYDPIVFSNVTTPEFHRNRYEAISKRLRGYTNRSIISVVNVYKKVTQRLKNLSERGIEVMECSEKTFGDLMGFMASAARESGMALSSCAQERDLRAYGVFPGKCIDDGLIGRSLGWR